MRRMGENTPIIDDSEIDNHYWNIPETNEPNQNIVSQEDIQQPPIEEQIDAPAAPQAEQREQAEPIQQTPRRSNRPKRKPRHLIEFVTK